MNYFFNKKANNRNSAGFALFYAVVVVAVITSLGAVLSSLIVREANLSATSRESSLAYYSADAGLECAQYWDLQEDSFPRTSTSSFSIKCAGDNPPVSASSSGSTYQYDFQIDNNNICSDVTVKKFEDGGRKITQIESIGSDECGASTRVQRALRTTY